MSNLGGYQRLTTIAKKVGGPIDLVLIIAGSGAVIFKTVELLGKKVVKDIKRRSNKEKMSETEDIRIYTVTEEGTSNDGLEFKIGDQFKILETDKDSILIEKIGDDNNPYFVSKELLKNISNYNLSEP